MYVKQEKFCIPVLFLPVSASVLAFVTHLYPSLPTATSNASTIQISLERVHENPYFFYFGLGVNNEVRPHAAVSGGLSHWRCLLPHLQVNYLIGDVCYHTYR